MKTPTVRFPFLFAVSLLVCFAVAQPLAAHQAPSSEAPSEEQLIERLRDTTLRSTAPETVFDAMDQLGKRRSLTAIPDLVGLLAFRRHLPSDDPIGGVMIVETHVVTLSERYPAIKALSMIGKPALPALIATIRQHSTESQESKNAWYTVVIGIYRDDMDGALGYFNDGLRLAVSAKETRRIQHAIDQARELRAKLVE